MSVLCLTSVLSFQSEARTPNQFQQSAIQCHWRYQRSSLNIILNPLTVPLETLDHCKVPPISSHLCGISPAGRTSMAATAWGLQWQEEVTSKSQLVTCARYLSLTSHLPLAHASSSQSANFAPFPEIPFYFWIKICFSENLPSPPLSLELQEQGQSCLLWWPRSFTKLLEWSLLQAHLPHPDSTCPSSLWCNELVSLCPADSSGTYTVSSDFCHNKSPIQNFQAEITDSLWHQ